MKSKTFISILILKIIIILLITSCPNPINENILNNVKDEIAPEITISSPEEGSYCANIVEVTGTVTDKSTKDGKKGEVKSLAYEVTGTDVSGAVEFKSDGAFNFQFETNTLANNFTMTIKARDWNANETIKTLALCRLEGNGIPSFTAEPGSKQIELSWDAVSHTQSYTLYYTTNGSLPSDENGKSLNINSSLKQYTLSGLDNGNLHVFRLKANPKSGWTTSWSDYIQTIPLSEQTLAPMVFAEVGKIRIEWNTIQGTDKFEVWRSTQIDGNYYNLSGPMEGNLYIDTGVEDNTWYYYKVKPAYFENSASAANGTQSDPLTLHQPVFLCAADTPDEAYRVAVDGSYAYVVDRDSGMHIFDISEPENTIMVGSCDTAGSAFNLAIDGNYAFVADMEAGLVVIDISNKTNPYIEATRDTPDLAVGIAINGQYAYVADNSSIQVFDIQTPTSPAALGGPVALAWGIAVNGSYLYATGWEDGVSSFSLADPAAPVHEATCDTPGGAWGFEISGSYAYVGDSGSGLQILDISDPAMPMQVGSIGAPFANAYSVVVNGKYAYVTDQGNGLRIIDISSPASPQDLGLVPGISAWPNEVIIQGSYIFVADGSEGIKVVDVWDPDKPILIASYLTDIDNAIGITVSGSYVYVTDNGTDLKIINLLP